VQSIDKIASWKLTKPEAGDPTSRELADHGELASLRTASCDSFLFVRPNVESEEMVLDGEIVRQNFLFLGMAQFSPNPTKL
jgi:hypothetical protein